MEEEVNIKQDEDNLMNQDGSELIDIDNDESDQDKYVENVNDTYKGLLIEMEFAIDNEKDHYGASIIQYTIDLLKKWKDNQVIEGVLGVDNSIIVMEFDNIYAWASCPRIITKKYYVSAEIIVMVKINGSAYALYSN